MGGKKISKKILEWQLLNSMIKTRSVTFFMLEYQNIIQFNKAEFIGRTFAKPHVFLEEDLVV